MPDEKPVETDSTTGADVDEPTPSGKDEPIIPPDSDDADETPSTPDPDEQSAFMKELLDESTETLGPPGEKPEDEAKGEGTEKPTAETPPAESTEVTKPGEGEEKPPELVEVTWTDKGVTHKQMMAPEAAESCQARLTTAEQFPTLQKKYIERLEAEATVAETGERPPGTEEAAPQETIDDLMQLTPDEWVKRWEPLVQEFAKTGYFGPEGELVEVAPQMCADIALMRAIGLPLAKAVNLLAEGAQAEGEERYMQRFFNEMDAQLDELSNKGGAFEPLADKEMRAKFFGHLQQFNVDSDVLFDPEFLAGQWRAFNQAMFDQVEQDAAALAAKKRDEELKRGQGARPGHTSGAPSEKAPDEQTGFMRKLLEPD